MFHCYKLGGGRSNILYFTPILGLHDPIWFAHISLQNVGKNPRTCISHRCWCIYLYIYLYKLPCMACLCSCWFTRKKCSACVFVALFFCPNKKSRKRNIRRFLMFSLLRFVWFVIFLLFTMSWESSHILRWLGCPSLPPKRRVYRFHETILRKWARIPSEMVNHHEKNTIWEEYVWIFFQASDYTNPSCLLYLICMVFFNR